MGTFYLISGANSGIGRSLAEDLAQKGHHVFATAPTEKERQSLVGISEHITPLLLDIRSSEHIVRLKASILEHTEHLDGLINNAGIGVVGPVEFIDVDDIRNIFEVNVLGHIKMTQTFLPLLRKSKRPRIVFTGSVAGLIVHPMGSAYSASKFALRAFCDALRLELKGQHIHVSLIQPGRIKTPLWSTTPNKFSDDQPGFEPYRGSLVKMRKAMMVNARSSPPVSLVTKVMNHALFSKHPKAKYLVGPDAYFVYWIRILPSFLVDRILIHLFT